MPINSLSTANTFEQWLIATQSLIEKSNFYESNTVIFYQTVNDISNTANLVFANSAVVNAQTTIVLTVANNLINANIYAQSAYNIANQALNLAANASNLIYEITDDNSNNVTLFPALFVSNTGTPNTAYVSSSKLKYNPSTGNLTSSIIYATEGLVSPNIISNNINVSGTVSATDFNSTSDISLKENIFPIDNSLDILDKLTGVKFNWKETKEVSYGLLAQEVEKHLPEIVKIRESGIKGINYLNIIAILIESVKELKKEIQNIKNNK